MSKATRKNSLILAAIVFFAVWFICGITFMESDTPSWLIGLISAAVLGVGAYFVFEAVQKHQLKQSETARQLLTSLLPPGETLLAYVKGYTGPGRTGATLVAGYLGDKLLNAPRRTWYYLAATKQHLILVELEGETPTGVPQIIERGDAKQLSFESGFVKEPKILLEFGTERMELRVELDVPRAKELDTAWHSIA